MSLCWSTFHLYQYFCSSLAIVLAFLPIVKSANFCVDIEVLLQQKLKNIPVKRAAMKIHR